MKDTIIKGDGTSRTVKAPATMPETFEEWRSQLVNGTATLDIGLNEAGCDVVGTALNKNSMLTDATAAALELESADPTVNEALYALSQKTQPAVLKVTTTAGVVVTATLGDTVLSATADSSGLAVLYPDEFGTWTLKGTISGKTLQVPIVIDAIAVFETTLTTDLEAASWALINAVAEAGNAASVWSVGDKKTINVGGVSYQAQIIGFAHDTKTAGGTAGITFQLVDCLGTTYQMESSNTNANGWEGCAMRKNVMPTLLGQLDEDLQKVIKAVNKKVSVGNNTSTIETVSDKLFLLSEIEIFGSTSYSFAGEGSQYAYYKAGNSKVKKVNGSADYWWERSPYSGYTNLFCAVSSNGSASSDDASGSDGVSFGFCV